MIVADTILWIIIGRRPSRVDPILVSYSPINN
jgi:hypothetical protein